MSKTVCFITRNFGKYDPDSLKGYESIGGFRALRKALTMEGCDIADVLAANGVQGRGGAAYDMGKKWRQAREVPGAHKCVVCNADEGEPGTFKDRELLTHDPFQLLEGMIIGRLGRGGRQRIHLPAGGVLPPAAPAALRHRPVRSGGLPGGGHSGLRAELPHPPLLRRGGLCLRRGLRPGPSPSAATPAGPG